MFGDPIHRDEEQFIANIQRRVAADEDVDFDSLIKQYPKYADRLKALRPPPRSQGDSTNIDESMESQRPLHGAGSEMNTTRADPWNESHRVDDIIPLGRFGDYELLEQVALGGMGIVFKAFQYNLHRVVALKSIRNGRFTTPEEVARFHQEARAAAVLNHPNIVPVHDYGEVDGQHYFTMEYVEGSSLAELIQDHPLPAQTAAEYVHTIARTVHYAHEQGIVHRDIKPSNVLIATSGEPRITDFGVAKPVKGNGSQSVLGQIIGTPNYMSPEQSLGRQGAAAPATDIYALGALLYSLLTSRPPFQAESALETLTQVRSQDPVSPRLLNAKVPRDLETICLKCLQKEPHRRYLTAQELADDLGRFLKGDSIIARPIRHTEKFLRICKRNPVITLLSASAIILVATLIGVQTIANTRLNILNDQLHRTNRQLDWSQAKLRSALEASRESKEDVDELLYVSDMKEAGRAWSHGDMRQLESSLKRQQPRPGERDLRGGEWEFLWNHARILVDVVAQNEQPLYFVGYSPDGRTIATCGMDAVIRLYDAATFDELMAIETGQIEVNGLSFDSDGTVLVSAGDDGTVRLWQLDFESGTADQIRLISAHEQQVYCTVLSPDGNTLFSAGRDPVIRIWDVATGKSLGTLEGHERAAGSIAMSSDGRLLASAGHDGIVALWDLETRSLIRKINPNIGRLTTISLSPYGNQLVIGSTNRNVEVRSIPSLKLIHEFEQLNAIQSSLFTPDGSAVIASDRGGMIQFRPLSQDVEVWKTRVGVPKLPAWKAHRDRVYAMAIAPDREHLLSVGADGKLLSWSISHRSADWTLRKEEGSVEEMAFTGDSGLLATVDRRRVELWNPHDGTLVRQLWQADEEIKAVDCCSAGVTLAVGGESGIVHLWNLGPDESHITMNLGEEFDVNRLAVSSHGKYLAAVERYDTDASDVLKVFDLTTGERLASIRSKNCDSAAFSQDEQWLLASGPFNDVQVWRLPDGELVVQEDAHVSSINQVVFSRDGLLAATASDDRTVKIWDTKKWKQKSILEGHLNKVESVTIAPDMQTLASTDQVGRIIFWHLPTGQMLFELDLKPYYAEQVAFSPDGKFLACRVYDSSQQGRELQVHLLNWRQPANDPADMNISQNSSP